jgi:hypothetical protein
MWAHLVRQKDYNATAPDPKTRVLRYKMTSNLEFCETKSNYFEFHDCCRKIYFENPQQTCASLY